MCVGMRAAVFKQSPHGYLILVPDFIIIDVNNRYLEMTATRRDGLVGCHLFEAFPDNPADETADGTRNLGRSLEIVLRTRRAHAMAVQKYDIPFRDSGDGSFEERYWQPLNTPVLKDGEVVAIIHHVEDVTLATIHRRDESIRLKLAAQFSYLGFCEYDPHTETINATQAFSRLFGFDGHEGTESAELYFDRIHRDDIHRLRANFAADTGETDGPVRHVDYRVVLPSGDERWLSTRSELVRTTLNAAPRFVMVTLDITETREHEEALDNAVNERDRLLEQKELLLRETHHRIKNSLQLVISILRIDALEAGETEAGKRLSSAAARVQAIGAVHELLYTAGQVSTVEFGDYLREYCASIAASGAGRRQGIEITCRAARVPMPTDMAISLALFLNELVSNALKYAFADQDRGTIRVTASPGPNLLELEVVDDGVGKSRDKSPDGLGTRIMAGLVAQLTADLTEQDAAPGHRVVVTVPLDS